MKFVVEQLNEVEEFLNELEQSTRVKFAKVFRKVQEGNNNSDDFKKLPGTTGIFEFRVSDKGVWYRILAFRAKSEDNEQPIILTTHGFKKKKNKTPQSEIDRAERLKRNYLQKTT